MARRFFVSRFLLPLVRGGPLSVGRALSLAEVRSLMEASTADPNEQAAARALRGAREIRSLQLVSRAPPTPLDEATFRLGAVVHNLLAMSDPRIVAGVRAEQRLERMAEVTHELASLGQPRCMSDVVARYSLLARVPEMVRRDHTVRDRLGQRTFAGQPPRGRFLGLASLPASTIETTRRAWLREVGVPVAGRSTFLALSEASPLGEALDPLRLDPSPSWGRVLSVLRYPALCRAVAGRLCGMGVARVGDALAEALYRFASLQDSTAATQASSGAIAFAIQFLSHLLWLDVIFSTSPTAVTSGSGGRELAVLLAAAEETEPSMVWPRDVPATSDLGRRFGHRLAQLAREHQVRKSPRWVAARDVARFAIAEGVPTTNGI